VIGGSATGCETALRVAQEGTLDPDTLTFLFYHQAEDGETLRELATKGTREVTVVDMLPRLADNVARTTRWALLKDLKTFHVRMMPGTKVTAVTDTGVEVEHDGHRETLPADTVILAAGARSRRAVYEKLEGSACKLYLIGDAKEPRKIIEAVSEGFHTALEI
jgi:2,4-dienoyl-CoA reductase (NADPH2)